MKKILNWQFFVVLALVAVGAAMVYSNYATKQANEGVEILQHIKGNPNAKVVLREHSDFQCPACRQFYPIVKELVEENEDLALEYKHFPLISIHPYAVPAARAAEAAAQQGKFFEMHDLLFENQETWSRSQNPRTFFDQYAEELELDLDQFRRQYGSSVLEDKVRAEYQEARELGLTGTPSFYLNGERLEYETFDDFRGAIAAALDGTDETAVTEEAAPAAAQQTDVRFGF